jgi:hypothetical protein
MKISEPLERLLDPIPESNLPKTVWHANFLKSETRSLVEEKGAAWVQENRQFLLAQLSFIWSP